MKPDIIVIEGLDGTGKSTIVDLLFNKLKKENIKIKKVHYEKEFLNEKSIDNQNIINYTERCSIWIKAFNVFIKNISNSNYDLIICDRYIYSLFAYTKILAPEMNSLVSELNYKKPFLKVLLTLDEKIRINRIKKRENASNRKLSIKEDVAFRIEKNMQLIDNEEFLVLNTIYPKEDIVNIILNNYHEKKMNLKELINDGDYCVKYNKENNLLLFPESTATILYDKKLNKILFVKQYRKSIKQYTIELPGGKVEKNETLDLAAERELLEETGYFTKNIKKLFSLDMDFSISKHRTHVYKGKFDFNKYINTQPESEHECVFYSIEESIEMILTNKISHAPTVSAIYWLKNNINSKK